MNETVRELGGTEGREEITLTGTVVPGDIVFTGTGHAAVTKHSDNGGNGVSVPVNTNELVSVDAASGTTFVRGAAVWWNPTTKLAVPEGTTGSRPLGLCEVAKTSGQITVLVRINSAVRLGTPLLGATFSVALAAVNAGQELLPAIPGYAYRIYGAKLTAVGGAAAGATAVVVRGTQGASAVNLIAAAVASLTQNTPVSDGSANVLAGGASYAQNDVNTPITLGVTGSALTGPTSVLVQLQYTLVAA